MKDPNNPCLFCRTKNEDIIEENELAYATFDSYPVSNHHCLIIPKRHVKDYFELNAEEITACDQLINLKSIRSTNSYVRRTGIGNGKPQKNKYSWKENQKKHEQN